MIISNILYFDKNNGYRIKILLFAGDCYNIINISIRYMRQLGLTQFKCRTKLIKIWLPFIYLKIESNKKPLVLLGK